MPRLFVAIYPIPFQKEISEIQKKISKFFVGKTVESDNLHVTLSFLGNVSDEKIDVIKKSLEEISSLFKPFEVSIDGMELIPNRNFFRVIALKVSSPEIHKLSQTIKNLVGGDVKPPHLTLARVKNVLDKKKLQELADKISYNRIFLVDSIKLMKSTLTRNGPIYSVIETFYFTQEYQ